MATSTTELTETALTKTNMGLSELLAKHDQGDLLCGIAEAVLQLIMEADVEGIIDVRGGLVPTCLRDAAPGDIVVDEFGAITEYPGLWTMVRPA